jgi:hypothetical protein
LTYCFLCFKAIHKTKKKHVAVLIKDEDKITSKNESVYEETLDSPSALLNKNENCELKSSVTTTTSILIETQTTTLVEEDTNNKEIKQDFVEIVQQEIQVKEEEEVLNEDQIKQLAIQLDDKVTKDLEKLIARCKQFDNIKDSIKTMNDQIKLNIYEEFLTITSLMKSKLDIFSDKIKLRLKDSFGTVRVQQQRIMNEISQIISQQQSLANRDDVKLILQSSNDSAQREK